MKKLSLLLFLFVLVFASCEKDEDKYTVLPADQAKAPVLKAHDAIDIELANLEDNTIFKWDIADFGVPTAAQYTLHAQIEGKDPWAVMTTFGDSLSIKLSDIRKQFDTWGVAYDTPTNVQFHLVASISKTYGTVQSAPITVSVSVSSDVLAVPTYPETLYMIGSEFGGWDWNAATVAEMTPVNGNPGKFWAVRYFADPASGFKWNTVKAWGGDFFSLGNDVGFTTADGNAFVAAAGFYIVVVDYTSNTITVEPAKVWGMGDCFGGWNTGQYPFVADGNIMKITATAAGELRIYTHSAAAGIPEGDWWRMEFVILDGKIAYRGDGGDQTRVPIAAGKVVTLDFNAGTGTIQ